MMDGGHGLTAEQTRWRPFVQVLTALSVLTVVGAGIALKDSIREEWWIWRLGSKDRAVQKLACERLEEIGSARAIPALLELWRDAGGEDFINARNPLTYWPGRGDNLQSAWTAMCSLAAKHHLPVLRGLEHASASVRWISARIFCENDAPPEGLPALASVLRDPAYLVRAQAAIALLRVGEAARPYFTPAIREDPELQQGVLELMKLNSPWISKACFELVRIDVPLLADRALPRVLEATKYHRAPEELPVLIQILQVAFRKGSLDTRIELARAIREMGPAAGGLVPELIEALGDPNRQLRVRAIIALGEIGRAAGDAVPFLTDALEVGDEGIRRLAEGVLGLIRADGR